MRSLFAGLVLAFATAVSAVSTTGNRLLVVLDDVEEKTAYTGFLGDLSGKLGYGSRMSELNWPLCRR